MKKFDEKTATSQELWDYCLCEYNSRNLITKKLINNFYSKLGKILNTFACDEKVLEVGCGAGESSRKIRESIKKNCFEVSDYDERYVKLLKSENLDFEVTVESVYSLKRKDKEFDRVIMLEVLEHLENIDLALEELFRVAKKSVIISVPNEPLWRILNMFRFKYLLHLGNTPGHINHFSEKSLKRIISKYGKVNKIYKPLPWIIFECKVI